MLLQDEATGLGSSFHAKERRVAHVCNPMPPCGYKREGQVPFLGIRTTFRNTSILTTLHFLHTLRDLGTSPSLTSL
jgi:hypothetical protein